MKDTSQEQQMNTSFPILSADELRQVFGSPPGQQIQTPECSGVLQVTSIPQPTNQPITQPTTKIPTTISAVMPLPLQSFQQVSATIPGVLPQLFTKFTTSSYNYTSSSPTSASKFTTKYKSVCNCISSSNIQSNTKTNYRN